MNYDFTLSGGGDDIAGTPSRKTPREDTGSASLAYNYYHLGYTKRSQLIFYKRKCANAAKLAIFKKR